MYGFGLEKNSLSGDPGRQITVPSWKNEQGQPEDKVFRRVIQSIKPERSFVGRRHTIGSDTELEERTKGWKWASPDLKETEEACLEWHRKLPPSMKRNYPDIGIEYSAFSGLAGNPRFFAVFPCKEDTPEGNSSLCILTPYHARLIANRSDRESSRQYLQGLQTINKIVCRLAEKGKSHPAYPRPLPIFPSLIVRKRGEMEDRKFQGWTYRMQAFGPDMYARSIKGDDNIRDMAKKMWFPLQLLRDIGYYDADVKPENYCESGRDIVKIDSGGSWDAKDPEALSERNRRWVKFPVDQTLKSDRERFLNSKTLPDAIREIDRIQKYAFVATIHEFCMVRRFANSAGRPKSYSNYSPSQTLPYEVTDEGEHLPDDRKETRVVFQEAGFTRSEAKVFVSILMAEENRKEKKVFASLAAPEDPFEKQVGL